MDKIFNTFDEAHKRLQQLLKEMIISQTTEELWRKVFTAKEWDDQYICLVREELQNRINENKN